MKKTLDTVHINLISKKYKNYLFDLLTLKGPSERFGHNCLNKGDPKKLFQAEFYFGFKFSF